MVSRYGFKIVCAIGIGCAEDIARYNAVTAEDVMRVYNKYIKDANSVVLSVVPKGQVQLAAAKQTFERPVRNI